MSGDSGSGGAAVSGRYARELGAIREVLDTAEVVGLPREEVELADLERLVAKYPDRAQQLLAKRGYQ